jgi:hypothetical protein
MMAVALRQGDRASVGRPRQLFEGPFDWDCRLRHGPAERGPERLNSASISAARASITQFQFRKPRHRRQQHVGD